MTADDFKKYFEAETENIGKVLKDIDQIVNLKSEEMDNIKLAAAGTFLHNFYNGIENILKRALLAKGTKIKNTPEWHKETLLRAKSLNIISEELHTRLIPFLAFRHHFVHGYSFKLTPDELLSLLKQTNDVFDKFKKTIIEHFSL